MAAREAPWLLRLHEREGVRQLWRVVVALPGGGELLLGEANFETASAVSKGLARSFYRGWIVKVGVNTTGGQS